MQDTLQNRTIFCHDNIDILRGIDSATIDLIYLDPPFNKNKVFTAPIGTSAEGASFSDIFREKDLKEEWLLDIKEENYKIHNFLSSVKNIEGRKSFNFCYLAYMGVRLIECERVLKNTGSIYLHCDTTMSHYLKLLMDCIFGENNFQNEVIWHYGKWSNVSTQYQRNHDCILFYTKDARSEYTFNPLHREKRSNKPYHTNKIKGEGQLLIYDEKQVPSEIMKKYKDLGYKIVHVDKEGVNEHDVWSFVSNKELNFLNSQAKERTGYPTQKPLTLLKRIIEASTNKGDVVLDPFCGCATTLLAAEELGRQWIGIDISIKAYELLKKRLGEKIEQSDTIFHESLITFNTDPPERTDNRNYEVVGKYVYIISNKSYPGEYKVGIATDPKNRLNSYQIGDPDRSYKLEYSFLTPHFREIEKQIHSIYENKHEWVKGDMKKIIADIEGYKPLI